jgi:hypothetical protein
VVLGAHLLTKVCGKFVHHEDFMESVIFVIAKILDLSVVPSD